MRKKAPPAGRAALARVARALRNAPLPQRARPSPNCGCRRRRQSLPARTPFRVAAGLERVPARVKCVVAEVKHFDVGVENDVDVDRDLVFPEGSSPPASESVRQESAREASTPTTVSEPRPSTYSGMLSRSSTRMNGRLAQGCAGEKESETTLSPQDRQTEPRANVPRVRASGGMWLAKRNDCTLMTIVGPVGLEPTTPAV